MAVVPPPWSLSGQAVVAVLRATGPGDAGPGRGLLGHLSAVAFVDYATSDVGPYRELLWIPHVTRWSGALGATVGAIWVDSEASVRAGRANWGLPKELARIERRRLGGGRPERWTAAGPGGDLAELIHRPFGPRVPVAKLPGALPLLQRRAGSAFRTPVALTALARPTSVWSLELDAAHLPDLRHHRLVGAVALSRCRLRFGAAQVDPLTPGAAADAGQCERVAM